MLPEEKCWVAEKGGNKSDKPLFGLAGNKVTCLNYCIYSKEGMATCSKWRGQKEKDRE